MKSLYVFDDEGTFAMSNIAEFESEQEAALNVASTPMSRCCQMSRRAARCVTVRWMKRERAFMQNVPNHLKLSDIQFGGKLCGYHSEVHSYQDAKDRKAIYYTLSNQDALSFTDGKSGFYDLLEVLDLLKSITNHSNTTLGITRWPCVYCS